MYIFQGDTSANINAGATQGWIPVLRKGGTTVGFQVNLTAAGTPIGLFVFEVTDDDNPNVPQGVIIGATPLILPASMASGQPTDGAARNFSFNFSPAPTAKWMRLRYARTSGGVAGGINVVATQNGQGSSLAPYIPLAPASTGFVQPVGFTAAFLWDPQNADGTGSSSLTNNQALGTILNTGSLGAIANLSQATTGLRCTWQAVGAAGKLNNKPTFKFVGAQSMPTGTFTAQAQPVTWYMVCRSNIVGTQAIFGGTSSDQVYFIGGTTLRFNAGLDVASALQMVANTFHSIGFTINGASSLGSMDGANTGTISAGTNTTTQVALGSDATPNNFFIGDVAVMAGYVGAAPTMAQWLTSVTANFGATPQ